jgi:hypothetical protein
MSSQLEEAAILGLRTLILGKHTPSSKHDKTETLLLDNIRHLQSSDWEPLLTTVHNSRGWMAIIFSKTSGSPICSSKGGDDNVVDALRNLLKHTSERIGSSSFAGLFMEDFGMQLNFTSGGNDYRVGYTVWIMLEGVVLIAHRTDHLEWFAVSKTVTIPCTTLRKSAS